MQDQIQRSRVLQQPPPSAPLLVIGNAAYRFDVRILAAPPKHIRKQERSRHAGGRKKEDAREPAQHLQ